MSETPRPVTGLEPADFTADWRAASERNAAYVERSPIVARGRDLTWIETPNEHRLAMLIGEQVGFPTNGTNLCKVIVPAGTHTGRHRHGEEALHVLRGTGAALIGGRRYDVRPGTTLHAPYMDDHQLINLGDEDMEVVTASTIDLDLFVRLGRYERLEDRGDNTTGFVASLPAEEGQFDALGRRIALHIEDAPDETENRRAAGRHRHGNAASQARRGETARSVTHPKDRLIKSEVAHRHGAVYDLMGGGESKHEHRNGFTSISVAMTQIFEEVPHSSSHDHTHTEAVLYVLEGVGFSVIDGVHYDWEAGDAVQIPPKMTRHEHFNPSDGRTRTLRIEYGIRYFYEQLWPGYFKIEHRETSMSRP